MMKADYIPIHPERGLDPHLTYCPRCGGETREIAIGVVIEYTLPNGQVVYLNKGSMHPAKFRSIYGYKMSECKKREITDPLERLPAREPCDACKEEMKKFAEIVADGGVYWECSECKQQGVIRHSPFTEEVKKKLGVALHEPAGFRFERCSQHAVESN